MTKHYSTYFLEGLEEGNRSNSVAFSSNKEKLISNYLYPDNKIIDAPDDEKQKKNDDNSSEGLKLLLDKALALGLSQFHLIVIARSARPIFQGSMAKFEVIDPITKRADLIEETDKYKVWGLNEDLAYDISKRFKSLQSLGAALAELPGAILMSLVATFDSFTAEVVREMLAKYPERYAALDKTVAIKDILSLTSIDQFITRLVDDDVYQFSRGSHEEQIKFIEKTFNVPISSVWKRYPDFIEVFERRNLIAHGEKTFNARYVRICKAAGHQGSKKTLGTPVKLSVG